jgi:inosose dehydratase
MTTERVSASAKTLAELRYACQTYSWQMSMNTYRGNLEHMISTAAQAGFSGFEPELVMLGDGWSPAAVKDCLDRHELELAALVLVEAWRGSIETPAERADAESLINCAAAIPGAKIILCPAPGLDRCDLAERQDHALACMAAVARRAAERGIGCSFHPNSPAGSVFRTAEDYDRMAGLLDPLINFTPDLGHIARGGMDPMAVVRHWGDRVDHVHVKDLGPDGSWAEIGTGVVDVPAVLDHLAARGFPGWVTFEDESPSAEHDPDAAVARNGDYVSRLIGGRP